MKKGLIIRKGFCACGCGGRTEAYSDNRKRPGWVKGQPRKFITGHNLKVWMKKENGGHSSSYKGGRTITPYGYVLVISPNHPRAKNNYVQEHILVAEKALGKYLPDKAMIHHVNGNKLDNRNKNLVVCENNKYHFLLHQRTRALKACGHADWRKCGFCKVFDAPQNLVLNPNDHNEYVAFHRDCYNKYYREAARRRKSNDNRS